MNAEQLAATVLTKLNRKADDVRECLSRIYNKTIGLAVCIAGGLAIPTADGIERLENFLRTLNTYPNRF